MARQMAPSRLEPPMAYWTEIHKSKAPDVHKLTEKKMKDYNKLLTHISDVITWFCMSFLTLEVDLLPNFALQMRSIDVMSEIKGSLRPQLWRQMRLGMSSLKSDATYYVTVGVQRPHVRHFWPPTNLRIHLTSDAIATLFLTSGTT